MIFNASRIFSDEIMLVVQEEFPDQIRGLASNEAQFSDDSSESQQRWRLLHKPINVSKQISKFFQMFQKISKAFCKFFFKRQKCFFVFLKFFHVFQFFLVMTEIWQKNKSGRWGRYKHRQEARKIVLKS